MMRVLIFSLAYAPLVGGAEVAVKEITDRIAPQDIEFHLVTLRFDPRSAREERIGNVHVHRIGRGSGRLSKFLFQFAAARAGLALHRRLRFDAVWAIMAHSAGVPAALFTLRQPRVPYILTLQEGDPPEHVERTMRPLWPLFSRAFTSADVVQVISTFLGSWARRRGFRGPLEIIPNGVDCALFSAPLSTEERSRIRQGWGLRAGDVALVTASRLVAKNAVDEVLRALPHLPENVHFIIYGTGSDEAALKKLCASLRIEARVRFEGYAGHEALARYLHAADIFVRPSRSEGMGNSFIEAMAAGLPVVGTQVGGIADFLFDAKNNPEHPATGWAVAVDMPKDIARAVREILGNPGEAQRVVENATALAARYDWDLLAAQMRARVFERAFKEGEKNS